MGELELWQPDRGLSDLAPALKNGACEAISSLEHERWGGCWSHVWRAVKNNRGKLKDSSEGRIDMLFTDLCFLHEVPWEPLLAPLVALFLTKWRTRTETDEFYEVEMADYLEQHILKHRFSRCHSVPGKPTDSNSVESMNKVLKSSNYFDNVEGLGTVLTEFPRLLTRFSENAREFAALPVVPPSDWLKAQKLIEDGIMKLTFLSNKTSYVLPSSHLLRFLPTTFIAPAEKKEYIKIWAKEYIALSKNPGGYAKMHDGSWDFDTGVDMLFSFWTVSPLSVDHTKYKELVAIGIAYTCTCPRFNHYHTCKHVIMIGIRTSKVAIPLRFNTASCGTHRAPAGAKLSKRGKCLSIDN